MIKLTTITHLVVLFLLLSVSATQAEDNERPIGCRADVEKLCKGIQPGGGRIAMCLKQNKSRLSPGCREAIGEAKEQIKEFAEACKPDAEKLCKGVQPGKGRIARCLVEHKDQLSAGCREKIVQAQSRHPCLKDIEALCKGVQPGEGRIGQCLKQHEAELSAECKAKHPRRNAVGRKSKRGVSSCLRSLPSASSACWTAASRRAASWRFRRPPPAGWSCR